MSMTKYFGIALKALKEIDYHKSHLVMWITRLGDGTKESHERIQTAFNELWMFVGELYEEDELDVKMQHEGFAISGIVMKSYLLSEISSVLLKRLFQYLNLSI